MTESDWRADFLKWYEETNTRCVEARRTYDMLDELRNRFDEASPAERTWMVGLLHEWQHSENEYHQYDSRALLQEFRQEL